MPQTVLFLDLSSLARHGGRGICFFLPRLQTPIPGATIKLMNKAIVTYASLDEKKDAELREWQALPAHERLRAVAEMTLAAWRMKEPSLDVPRMERTLVHLPRPTNARKCVEE